MVALGGLLAERGSDQIIKLLKAHGRVQALSPKPQEHYFSGSGICLQEWKEVPAAGEESVIHLTASVRGKCSLLCSELLPKPTFFDIGLTTPRDKITRKCLQGPFET